MNLRSTNVRTRTHTLNVFDENHGGYAETLISSSSDSY